MNDTQNSIEPIKEKLDDKIKKLNSSRVIKKVTPKGDLSWYVKWVSVAFVCVAVLFRSVEEIPKIYDITCSIFGTAGWLWVGFKWHDRALIILNTILLAMLVSGAFRFYISHFGLI